ncbi:MAG: 2Fe-2S iron-sulfur cluster binding domain-containing protein [Alphaproteobacteria bacterium]|nr:2Fe-2S iron-sulfur cluster binding domain-containing protein [Alphaproteobacteria bacterium]MBU2083978.1 2Fe-2S iron-sulfur cluster binding domain-containing protein [Alphaproteobacteria bacterium]MBU2142642.1 2Fe-2S iron-sulfur cluster binding domain-containing protein [Alphaproteobacteria bacterium]MBU2196255.1 2Fe-2S iron-sulfur cluster binding domain-containing protein [Alphaproteobacteria bacterium]
MPTIHITTRNGSDTSIAVNAGVSLMEALTEHDLDVEAVCGGAASCGTCHVHIAPDWFERLGPREELEAMLLDGLLNTDETSRLGCQITLADAHDGLTLTIAEVE